MIDYLIQHAKELGIDVQELYVFSLCRAVNYTINCVLKYPVSCNDWFLESAAQYQYTANLLVHPQGVHGFDYANDDEHTKDIIENTIAFLKDYEMKGES